MTDHSLASLERPRMAAPRWHEPALRCLCPILACYFRFVPIPAGKAWLWTRFMRPYILWRRMEAVTTTRFGSRIHGALPDVVFRTLYFFGVWEPVITRYVSGFLRPGDTVIDVGGNIGAHALLFAHLVGPGGRVHTIEASPAIYRRLLFNLQANDARNVTPYNVAVSDRPGQVTIYLHNEDNLGASTIVAGQAARLATRPEAVIEARPLHAIVPLEAVLAARLIKIDVEGAEWLVLQGMRDVLPRLAPDAEVLLELNDVALAGCGGSIAEVVAMFAEAGFSAYRIENEYGPDAYVRARAPRLRPLTEEDGPLVDVIMRRRS